MLIPHLFCDETLPEDGVKLRNVGIKFVGEKIKSETQITQITETPGSKSALFFALSFVKYWAS